MKSSKFNTFFKYQGLDIGFNGYTGEFIVLDPLLFELYDVGKKIGNFAELKEIHGSFYNFLIQQGFLIEENLDEFEMVKELSYKVDNDDSNFHLIINPTMNCNFKCWYCYETHIKDSKMDSTTITATINLVNKVIENQKGLKTFHLAFFGGEPLLYFDKVINPILKAVSALCKNKNIVFHSSMTTNGLLINQKMLTVCKEYNLNSFQITLDGSKEQHNKIRFISEGKGSYDKIVENILLVAENQLYANIRINCSVDTLAGLNDIINSFELIVNDRRKFIHFDFQEVWQETENIGDALKNARIYFREKGFSVGRKAGFDTIVTSCYGDKRYQATLNYNGEVFKCTARDFKDNSGEGQLNDDGTIIWNEKYEKRLNSKFKNAPCKECRILPICGGGCTQQALENEGRDYCVYNFDEGAKTNFVIERFLAEIA